MVEGDNAVLAEGIRGKLASKQGVVKDVQIGDTGVVALDVVPDFNVLLLR